MMRRFRQNEFKTELPCIGNCMVIGDKRKFLSILIALRGEASIATSRQTHAHTCLDCVVAASQLLVRRVLVCI